MRANQRITTNRSSTAPAVEDNIAGNAGTSRVYSDTNCHVRHCPERHTMQSPAPHRAFQHNRHVLALMLLYGPYTNKHRAASTQCTTKQWEHAATGVQTFNSNSCIVEQCTQHTGLHKLFMTDRAAAALQSWSQCTGLTSAD